MAAPQITHMTRNQHLVHMTRVLPLLSIIFCLQCFLIPSAFPDLQLGNLYFVMAIMLCTGVVGLYLYDTQTKIFIKDHQLFWQIPMLKIGKSYNLMELQTIDVFDIDQPFSNIKLHFNKKIVNLYFIDNPTTIIKSLWQAKKDAMLQSTTQNTNDDKQAA